MRSALVAVAALACMGMAMGSSAAEEGGIGHEDFLTRLMKHGIQVRQAHAAHRGMMGKGLVPPSELGEVALRTIYQSVAEEGEGEAAAAGNIYEGGGASPLHPGVNPNCPEGSIAHNSESAIPLSSPVRSSLSCSPFPYFTGLLAPTFEPSFAPKLTPRPHLQCPGSQTYASGSLPRRSTGTRLRHCVSPRAEDTSQASPTCTSSSSSSRSCPSRRLSGWDSSGRRAKGGRMLAGLFQTGQIPFTQQLSVSS